MVAKKTLAADDEKLLAELGIKQISVDYFIIDGFRYSKKDDAIAQALRTAALSST